MNRTVRDVGGLILAIILMIAMYGTYRGGSVAVGGQTFGAMHRMVAGAFSHADILKTEPWSASKTPDSINALKDKVPKGNWKKGIRVYNDDAPANHVNGGLYTLNNDGSYSIRGLNGSVVNGHANFNQVNDSIFNNTTGINMHGTHMTYDPQKNALKITK